MATEKKSLYEEAVALLERVNTELSGSKRLDTINCRMIGVVKELNDVAIENITGNTKEQ